jgi:hypothetical protein
MQVIVPRQQLCCGRPLYDYGMLTTAKRLLRETMDALHEEIAAGTPLVGIEPSCLAVFRDELYGMFPHHPEAQRLWEQSYTLSEFLARKVDGYEPPQLRCKALVHGHCHHKSIMKFDAEKDLLARMGLDIQMPESGCCGMAGSFGFEADKYDVSVKCGERVLLPAVRAAAEDTLILADGFSCMEQIKQLTGRQAVHLAEAIEMALRAGGKSKSSGKLKPFVKAMERTPPGVKLMDTPRGGQTGGNGEAKTVQRGRSRTRRVLKAMAGGVALAAATLAGTAWRREHKRAHEGPIHSRQ